MKKWIMTLLQKVKMVTDRELTHGFDTALLLAWCWEEHNDWLLFLIKCLIVGLIHTSTGERIHLSLLSETWPVHPTGDINISSFHLLLSLSFFTRFEYTETQTWFKYVNFSFTHYHLSSGAGFGFIQGLDSEHFWRSCWCTFCPDDVSNVMTFMKGNCTDSSFTNVFCTSDKCWHHLKEETEFYRRGHKSHESKGLC